ncbi:putative peptidase protein (caspase-1 like protein) [Rhizobium etli CFN 42]|uniref:Peptidase protein (Caspase-1 like protein) n=1 Tax=Rhizobium etli (strain ATCC 51251 / DSM 11541 / JCM 21823 / NBRC 15573 / CFN 42) TaxID=347834 RepID=Q2K8T2_RHIEC|nr:caspase family protein [Rhizobium etli]ABC90754.1 putative peptidase protein (caspase-1 like protein) [Rhizobium etli CFN 42]
MRKALIVGIDHYEHISPLNGCVNDAHSVRAALERNSDGTTNFKTPRLITGTGAADIVERAELKEAVRALFADQAEIALFYFAGHGYIEDTGGFLCAGDCKTGDDGLSLNEVMTIAAASPAINKVIILDSCHSGIAGERPAMKGFSEISTGMTILTASTADQYALETGGPNPGGVFTSLLVDALSGAAANLVGDVTPGSVYAHIDQSLGPWAGQRPLFKTNVQTFVSLKKADAPIPLSDLQQLATLFPTQDYAFPLDPGYEPERSAEQKADPTIPPPDPAKTAVFAILQKFVKVNLVRPVNAPHMWHAAMQSKSCELTVLGEHYRKLVEAGMI